MSKVGRGAIYLESWFVTWLYGWIMKLRVCDETLNSADLKQLGEQNRNRGYELLPVIAFH